MTVDTRHAKILSPDEKKAAEEDAIRMAIEFSRQIVRDPNSTAGDRRWAAEGVYKIAKGLGNNS
jgi:hypothetical protein